MEGKIALEEHFSTELNNMHWDAKGEESRNGRAYAQDVERRLLDPKLCIAEIDRAGIELCIMSLTSPGVQGVIDPKQATELARSSNDYAHSFVKKYSDLPPLRRWPSRTQKAQTTNWRKPWVNWALREP